MDLPLHDSCRLLKVHPSGLMALEKAAGVMSHPNRAGDEQNSLLRAGYDYGTEAYSDGGRTWYLINRLDAPTSGVILMADSPEVARTVKESFSRHAVTKQYVALLKGIPPRQQDTWRDHLKVIRQRGALRTVVTLGHANALCEMRMLERGSGPPARALVCLSPVTGKTHQLRVQCAHRHLPIIGDATYGEYAFNREFKRQKGLNRLFLHSWKTQVHLVVGGAEVNFQAESPVPEIFAVALR